MKLGCSTRKESDKLDLSHLDWITHQMMIACRWSLVEQMLDIDPWEMLDLIPEAYFVGDGNKPPSMVIPRYIEVTVIGQIGFDIRNLQTTRGWTMQIDDGLPTKIEEGTQFLKIEGQPKTVVFLYCGGQQLFFNLFYEEE